MRAPDNLTAEEKSGMYPDARIPVLPYLMQDNDSRRRVRGKIPTVAIENKFLRAVFYPTLGGRMTSLYDKKRERELLLDNPLIQPANLAIRNARANASRPRSISGRILRLPNGIRRSC